MPTTRAKNILYRLALPWKAPCPERKPELRVLGSPLHTREAYIRLLRKHHVMGSAALIRDQQHRVMLLSSSFHPNHPVRENSLFRVASITKMATALAALAAVEEGMIDLEAPFLSCFPDLKALPELQGVTFAHLLSHTSGLKDPDGMEGALLKGIPFPDLLSGCRLSPPGEAFHYSNLGFGLMGCALEALYDLPVSVVLQRLVFDPLEMRATLDASTLDAREIVPITRILPYHPEKELRMTPLGAIPLKDPDPLRHYGHTAGAMYTDLPSLEKMMECLQRNGSPILSPFLGTRMKQRRAEYGAISPTLSYGLGMLRITDRSISPSVLLGHQGFAYGCADGAFWEEDTGRMILFLNGGASEARLGRLGLCNYDVLRWALRKEMPQW